MKRLFLLTIALGPVFRLLTYFVYTNHPFLLPNTYLAVYALPFSQVDAFAIGAYISQYQLPQPRKQLAIMACALPLLGFFTQYLAAGIIDPGTLGYEFKMFTAYKFIWGYSVLNYFFALVVHSVDRTRLFVRILDNFVLRYIGKISYGIYVYHVAVIWFISQLNLWNLHGFLLNFLFTYFVALLITVIISSISFHFLEKPINNLKDRFFAL